MTSQSATAFVLRTWPLRESDLIASLFSSEHGKLRGVAHGACRPKGAWAGALDPMTEISFTWSLREGQELASLSGPTIVRSPYRRRLDLAQSWTLAHVAELVDETAPAQDPDETLYRLLRSIVEALVEGAPPVVLARYAQAWVLRLHGVLPDLATCAGCGAPLAADGGTWHWSLHGLGCGACLPAASAGPVLLPEDLAFLELVRRRAPRDVPAPSDGVRRRTGAFLSALLRELTGKELRSERFLLDLD